MKTQDTYGCIITQDRYTGAYNGGYSWIACPPGVDYGPAFDNDWVAMNFWETDEALKIGRGQSPQEAYEDMVRSIACLTQ